MTREEAMDLLDNLIGMVEDSQDNDYDEALKMAIEALRERPKGEWIEESDNHGHSSYFCSRCGTQEGEPSGFCPNCGARMKGADNEEDGEEE